MKDHGLFSFQDLQVITFLLYLVQGAEESAPELLKAFQLFHWSHSGVLQDCLSLRVSFIFVGSVLFFLWGWLTLLG